MLPRLWSRGTVLLACALPSHEGTVFPLDNDLQVATIPPQEVKRRLDAQKALVLLDVREEQELTGELGHLPGVQHIPIGSLTGRLSALEACKAADLVTICRSSGRAHSQRRF